MTDLVMVHGAKYRNTETGEVYTFLGLKSNRRLVLQQRSGHTSIVPYDDFKETFEDTGIHDHEGYCCTVHDIHTMPHKGCILR